MKWRHARRPQLPLKPLFCTYIQAGVLSSAELYRLPGLGPRFAAIHSATARFLYTDFLDHSSDDDFRNALVRFYEAVVCPPLHVATLARRAGFVRHALSFLLRGQDLLLNKWEACVAPYGDYHVSGLGPSFWSAILQALAPQRNPGWTSAILAGASKLGLLANSFRSTPQRRLSVSLATSSRSRSSSSSGLSESDSLTDTYNALLWAHGQLRTLVPQTSLSALHLDHFLSLVANMSGRQLPLVHPAQTNEVQVQAGACPVTLAVRRVRGRYPLRDRLRRHGQVLADAQECLHSGLREQDHRLLGKALTVADPNGVSRGSLDWNQHREALLYWVRQLWHTDDPYLTLERFLIEDPLPGAKLWLPAAVLHLRDPQNYMPANEAVRRGLASLDDGDGTATNPVERYRLLNEAATWLHQKHGLHPLEVPDVFAELHLSGVALEQTHTANAKNATPPKSAKSLTNLTNWASFSGFCGDTFSFLRELADNNCRTWMQEQRERYQFTVRQPVLELCQALAQRYINPVLCLGHGWQIDTRAQGGHALTRIAKNHFGRARPYNTAMWIMFAPATGRGQRKATGQLFVRLEPDGVRIGLRLGQEAKPALARFRNNLQNYAEVLWSTLSAPGPLGVCNFGLADSVRASGPLAHSQLNDAEGLRTWAQNRSLEACWHIPAYDPRTVGEDLVGEVLLAFDRLVPLFACCLEEDVTSFLHKQGVLTPQGCTSLEYTEREFYRDTHLGRDWLTRVQTLLGMKRQLVLQGVPGTGKTHVARCLARLLTRGQDDAVRLVQFHPAYSYEEFVEGIKVRSVAVDGKHEVTYPVEDGLLCALASEAEAQPGRPFVLIIDELNRGNLPRIFGELLYLLEYRGQAVGLPYSRRAFRLPSNLYLLATMNTADRSVARLDDALRRRFSFVELEPDLRVLSAWLEREAEPTFAERVKTLFVRLNERLGREVGPHARIGHSYFMVPGIDADRLRVVWQHHIRPLLEEHLVSQPGRVAGYDLERLLEIPSSGKARRGPVSVQG